MRLGIPLLVVLSIALVVGCRSSAEKQRLAAEKFGQKYTCPDETVTIKPSTVPWRSVAFTGVPETPPVDVKSDPVRLAKWNSDQQKQNAPLLETYDKYDVFEAHGCSHDSYVGCIQPAKTNGPSPAYVCDVIDIKK